jgi:hydrogenase large subunit
VGGVSNPINTNSQSVLSVERLLLVKECIDKLGSFIRNCYLVDVAAIGAFYADWTQYGAGITDYLSIPDVPTDTKHSQFMMPGGYITGGDLATFKPITSPNDPFFRDGVAESVKHSWYSYEQPGALHPWKGETTPHYVDFQDDGKYSWIKSPTFYGKPAQVGPLANVLVGVASGHQPTITYLNQVIDTCSSLAGTKIPLTALHSTIGRHAARAVRSGVLHEALQANWQALMENIAKGDVKTWNKPVFPKGEIHGVGAHEAPRGVLSHWSVIKDGKIANYQCVVPTTWNAAPRNEDDQIGPYEASLLDNPVADPERPLEVLRTVHSFDPCLACAVHLTDLETKTVVQVKAL